MNTTIYDSYQEAKDKNPSFNIATPRADWDGCQSYIGKFRVFHDGLQTDKFSWMICDDADYQCFLEEKPSEKAEWVNGDKCIYNDGKFTFVSYMCKPEEDYVVIWRPIDGVEVVYKTQISKPETKQQREDRERLEAAYDLYCEWRGEMHESFDAFKRCNHDNWLSIVDKTKYRISK